MKKAYFQATLRAREPKYRAKMYKKGKNGLLKVFYFLL
ncbi:hypothetical protein IGI80_002913 [Enterococcus sp. DIV1420a]